MQRRPLVLIRYSDIGPALDEQLRDRYVSVRARDAERRVLLGHGAGVDVGAVLEEEAGEGEVSGLARVEQKGIPVGVRALVHVRPVADEQLGDGEAAPAARQSIARIIK
jgi:hypothetical protein